jgi:hypothetical protein
LESRSEWKGYTTMSDRKMSLEVEIETIIEQMPDAFGLSMIKKATLIIGEEEIQKIVDAILERLSKKGTFSI